MSKRVVIFGASGGIGSATYEVFKNAGYLVTPIAGRQINFVYMASHSDVDDILEQVEPDIIINISCAISLSRYKYSSGANCRVITGFQHQRLHIGKSSL